MVDPIAVPLGVGGEVQSMIDSLNGKEFTCDCNRRTHRCENWLAFVGDVPSGLKGDDGRYYWIFIRCPVTNYDWSYEKIQNRVA